MYFSKSKGFALLFILWMAPFVAHGATTTYIPSTSTYNAYQINIGTAVIRSSFTMVTGSTFTTQLGTVFILNSSNSIRGTVIADNANTGFIGEYVSSQAASTPFPAPTGHIGDLAAVFLSSGDWDVSGGLFAPGQGGGNDIQDALGAITTTAGDTTTGMIQGVNRFDVVCSTINAVGIPIIAQRASLSSGTTYYLKFSADYLSGTPKTVGIIRARRMR